jgi:hypothetical protein
MGMKQIFQNFSWDTLASLPPSELFALVALFLVTAFLLFWLASFVASFWD